MVRGLVSLSWLFFHIKRHTSIDQPLNGVVSVFSNITHDLLITDERTSNAGVFNVGFNGVLIVFDVIYTCDTTLGIVGGTGTSIGLGEHNYFCLLCNT